MVQMRPHLPQSMKKVSNFDDTAQAELSFLMKVSRARRYGEGDRPGHTLPTLIRGPRGCPSVFAIKDDLGVLRTDPLDIASEFTRYYSDLYTSHT